MKLIPGLYVDKLVIVKMMASGANPIKKQPEVNPNGSNTSNTLVDIKKNFEWRMCACIVMKSCLIFNIPILTDE